MLWLHSVGDAFKELIHLVKDTYTYCGIGLIAPDRLPTATKNPQYVTCPACLEAYEESTKGGTK